MVEHFQVQLVAKQIPNTKLFQASSSGTNRVNNLLDGIPTTNAYLDSNAISVGCAIQSGVVLQKCNNHWCRVGTSQVVNSSLANRTTSTVVAIGATQTGTDCHSTFTTWSNSSGNNIRTGTCNKAPNGLWYDNCEGGLRPFYNVSYYCSSKEMRLPTTSEASAWSSSGVPSCSNWTWTSSPNNHRYGNHWVWNGSSTTSHTSSNINLYVRCVRQFARINLNQLYASSGTNRVNNLLDGVPTTNAYLDSNAISVGYAIQSGVVLQKCGNHWCRIGTSQVVNSSLVNSTSANVVSLVETYKYSNCSSIITQAKGTTKISGSCSIAGNGLMYDNCEGGNRTWINASSYCSSKGMRLPQGMETNAPAVSSSGVPPCINPYSQRTWTSTTSGENGSILGWRSGSNLSQFSSGSSLFVRCVKQFGQCIKN